MKRMPSLVAGVALIALVAACTSKKPPAKPGDSQGSGASGPQQGSSAPTVGDPDVDQRGADEGRPGADPSPTPLGTTQPAN